MEIENVQISVSKVVAECEALRTCVKAKEEEVVAAETITILREGELTAMKQQIKADLSTHTVWPCDTRNSVHPHVLTASASFHTDF